MKLADLIPFEQVMEEELRDPEFRAEWERLAPARAVANSLVMYRADHGLSQTALGRLLGMSQPAIARLESGDHLPTLPTLLRLSEALDLEILVAMTPANRGRKSSQMHDARVTEQSSTPGGASLTIAIRWPSRHHERVGYRPSGMSSERWGVRTRFPSPTRNPPAAVAVVHIAGAASPFSSL